MDPRDLLSGAGAAVLDQICADSRDDLALASALRGRHSPDLLSLALQQRALRQRASTRFVDAQSMLFTRAGLEQASSTPIARHRASRFPPGATVLDICCGIGGDSIELARQVDAVIGVDLDPVHLALAQHNAGRKFRPLEADAQALPETDADATVIDPARREGDHRRRGHHEMSPPLDVCLRLADVNRKVTVKAAPGLALQAVPQGWTVEAVALGRDLKEIALWSPAWGLPGRIATVIRGDLDHGASTSMTGSGGPEDGVEIAAVGAYLIDPNPAITRSGQVQLLARELGAWMLDEQIAFLSSDAPVDTCFGRTLRVLESLPWSLKPVKARLRAHNIGGVEIRQRGLTAGNVDDLRHRLAGKGDTHGVVVLTRLGQRPWAFLCQELMRY